MQYQEASAVTQSGASAFPSAALEAKASGGVGSVAATSYADYKVIRRNGAVVGFEPAKIALAMTKAFIAVRGGQGAASAAIREQVEKLTANVVAALLRRQPAGGTFHIEDIQDQVELSLMRDGAHDVARAYVLYREKRAQERARQKAEQRPAAPALTMIENGQ
ncbi:ribonucleoside-diphosphate reductase subunit alpha, partial [Betaproteobacteria bacterium PRO7]|nr:ribonucleoside-diphosphate reductase subunit alpha [Betaproteobacteria bacterium PRO7]